VLLEFLALAQLVSATVAANANVFAVGVSAIGYIGFVTIWGRIVPNPNTVYTDINPTPGTVWSDIEPSTGTQWTQIAA
jgi:hypothetical protein